MSDAQEYKKIAKMNALRLLNYVADHHYYLSDSYYRGFDTAIYKRIEELNMPSKSPAQKKTMAAIAHGWKPPKGSKVAKIPKKVAKEFNKADTTVAASKGKKK